MTILDQPPGIQEINRKLNQIRSERLLSNDLELAQYLHISDKTVSFIRNGRLNRVALVVAAVLTGDHSLLPSN